MLETSWEKIEHANRAEVAQRKEKNKRKYRSRVEALAQNEMNVEQCDCPTGATHACLLQDSNGRLLRRGDHIVRLGASRNRHAIFYGGTDGQEVLHHESRRGKTSLGDQRAKLLRKVRVGICAIEAFAKGDAIVVADYRGGAARRGGRAARTRARRAGSRRLRPFHLREEQWTHYCKTGATDAAAKQRYRLRARRPAPPKVTPRVDGETSTQHIAGGGGGLRVSTEEVVSAAEAGVAEAEADAALAGSVAASAAKAGAVEVSVPRKLATACGFSVYGLHAAATLATSAAQKRAQLLAVLRSRALVYAEADGAALLARLLLAFLQGDGYNYGTNGGAYQALRSRAQAEISASVGESSRLERRRTST